MATVAELRDRLIENADEQASVITLADTEKRDLSDDETQKLDTLQADYEAIEKEIELRERAEQHNEKLTQSKGPAAIGLGPPRLSSDDDDDPRQLARNQRTPVKEPARALDKGRRGFDSLGSFAAAVSAYCADGGNQDLRLREMLAPTTWGSSSPGADGGFAIPPDFRSEITEKITSENTLLGLCDQLTTSSNSITVPVDQTTPWQTSGGILTYWAGEGSQLTESKPNFEARTVQLHKLTALVPVTEELLADAPALDRYLRRKAPEKINFAVDKAIIFGTGAGQPLGIMNSPCLITTSSAGGGANTVITADINNAYTRMYGPYRGRPSTVWLANQAIEPQILALHTSTNNNVFIGYPSFGIQPAPGMQLYGHRIIYTQACADLGTTGDLIFAALGEYMAATKGGGIRVDTSMHLYFDYDMMAFRFILRIAGMPWLSSTISPLNGSTTYSSFVALPSTRT